MGSDGGGSPGGRRQGSKAGLNLAWTLLLAVLLFGAFLFLFQVLAVDSVLLGILMTFVAEALFFWLAFSSDRRGLLSTDLSPSTGPSQGAPLRSARVFAVLLIIANLGCWILVQSGMVAVQTQFDLQIAAGQIEASPHGRLALILTSGGALFLFAWLPLLALIALWLGSGSERISFGTCTLVMVMTFGVFVIVNAAYELAQGRLAAERIFAVIYGADPGMAPVAAERWAIVVMLFGLLIGLILVMAGYVWLFARVGFWLRRRRDTPV